MCVAQVVPGFRRTARRLRVAWRSRSSLRSTHRWSHAWWRCGSRSCAVSPRCLSFSVANARSVARGGGSRAAAGASRHDHGLGDEAVEQVDDDVPVDCVVAADSLDGLGAERAGERGEPVEQSLFGFEEEVVRPRHCVVQRAMPFVGVLRCGAQQSESVVKPGEDVGRSENTDTRHGELESERHAVELHADLSCHVTIDRFQRCGEVGAAGPVNKERQRRRVAADRS